MCKKLFMLALLSGGAVWFVGSDAVSSAVQGVRTAARDALTADVPLENQLAEAKRQVDAYAESIIRGEVAAENLQDMITGVEREVRSLAVRVDGERKALAMLRKDMATRGSGNEIVATSVRLHRVDSHKDAAMRRVHSFRASSTLLDRRSSDLTRLKTEFTQTLQTLDQARTERSRLGEEVSVLAAEMQSLKARKAAARTRHSVGRNGVDRSGYAAAHDRITKIRSKIREQNKLLRYYQVDRISTSAPLSTNAVALATSDDPALAIDEALAAFPGQ